MNELEVGKFYITNANVTFKVSRLAKWGGKLAASCSDGYFRHISGELAGCLIAVGSSTARTSSCVDWKATLPSEDKLPASIPYHPQMSLF